MIAGMPWGSVVVSSRVCGPPAVAARICSRDGRGTCVTTSYVCPLVDDVRVSTVRLYGTASQSPFEPVTWTAGKGIGSHGDTRS